MVTKEEIQKNLAKLKNMEAQADYLEKLKEKEDLDKEIVEFVDTILKSIYKKIGEDFYEKGQLHDALDYFERAGEKTKIEEVYKKIGKKALEEERFYDAVEYLKKGLATEELKEVAATLEKREDPYLSGSLAGEIYEWVATKTKDPECYEKAGDCYQKIGWGKKAVEMYEKAKKIKKKELVKV